MNSFSAIFPLAARNHAFCMLSDWPKPNAARPLQEKRQHFRDWVELTNSGGAEINKVWLPTVEKKKKKQTKKQKQYVFLIKDLRYLFHYGRNLLIQQNLKRLRSGVE